MTCVLAPWRVTAQTESRKLSEHMNTTHRKDTGAYYTPDAVVRSLTTWAIRSPRDRMLDPSCGDGRFLIRHANSVGVEQDPHAASIVHKRAPGCLIHEGDFFSWAAETPERFDCAAGNPPFIRYQRFNPRVRSAAQDLCARHGASFSSLSSSWAPFIVATATLLRQGGRMAFVVPAEIGHAPYAIPALDYLTSNFDHVQLVAVRDRLFRGLSEDCWLLFAEGYGGNTTNILLSPLGRFAYMAAPPKSSIRISLPQWRQWNHRLRPFFASRDARDLYQTIIQSRSAVQLGEVARVGIGYVTGANDFFHLRPSDSARQRIPDRFLVPAVRNGRALQNGTVTMATVADWKRRDDPVMLLRLTCEDSLPRSVTRYLESQPAREARATYKCRMRDPWYAVPDVTVPDAFLTYMSGTRPSLVANEAGCVGTNSVHVVRLTGGMAKRALLRTWKREFTALSSEFEGHPLGGGMLKMEPREAARVVLTRNPIQSPSDRQLIAEGVDQLRQWRHYRE